MKNLSFFLLTIFFVLFGQGKTINFAAQDSPPFNFAVGNQVKGASYDIMVKACEKLGWQCQMEIVPQKRALTLAESGQYDGVWGIIQLKPREKYLNYSVPTWTAHLCYFSVQSQLQPFAKPNDLKGFTVLGVRSSASFEKAESLKLKVPDIKLIESNSYSEAFDDLFNNKYGSKTAVVTYSEVGRFIIADKKFKKSMRMLEGETVQFRVGFSKKLDKNIVTQFDRVLSEMRKSGELKNILSKYAVSE